jgi:hypothetical protein
MDAATLMDALNQYGPFGVIAVLAYYYLRPQPQPTATLLGGLKLPPINVTTVLGVLSALHLLTRSNGAADAAKGLVDSAKKLLDALSSPQQPELK